MWTKTLFIVLVLLSLRKITLVASGREEFQNNIFAARTLKSIEIRLSRLEQRLRAVEQPGTK